MPRRFVTWWCAFAFVAAGCLIEDGDVCGPHQRRIEEGFLEGCVCEEGAAPNESGVGCHPCGKHEVVRADACVCKSGFARAGAGDDCKPMEELPDSDGGTDEPATSGQDMSCSSADDCAGFDASYCLTLQAPTRCLVPMCADGTNRCGSDRDCCVITVLPELAATGGLCVPKGTCMAPGMVVTP